MPISQLLNCCSPSIFVFTVKQLSQQRQMTCIDPTIDPDSFNLVMSIAFILRIKVFHPLIKCFFDRIGITLSKLPPHPRSNTTFGPLQLFQQILDPGTLKHGSFLQWFPFFDDPPNPSRMTVTAFITQRILRMSFHRVVPITDVQCSTGSKADINWNETEISGKDQVADILLVKSELPFNPTVYLNTVGWLVPRLDVAALQLIGKCREINELLSACSRICTQSIRTSVLSRIRWVERVKSSGKDRVTGDMLPPIVKRHSPRVCARIGTETGQPVAVGIKAEPATILLTNRTIRCLDLTVMKDRLTKNQITVRSPYKVVK